MRKKSERYPSTSKGSKCAAFLGAARPSSTPTMHPPVMYFSASHTPEKCSLNNK